MIHIMQSLCPARHCFAAVAWDDASKTEDEAAHDLALAIEQITGGKAPYCGLCGATVFHAEDGVTRFETMEQARPHLVDCQEAQLATRRRLLGERN